MRRRVGENEADDVARGVDGGVGSVVEEVFFFLAGLFLFASVATAREARLVGVVASLR